jgi:murein DD-endopeptidase MepM/ murein hydrolase activator NlpD
MRRRLLPTARSFITQSGQLGGLLAVAVLAMAAGPLVAPVETHVDAGAVPTAPPVTAVAEPAGPMTRQIAFSEPVRGYAINSKFGMRRLGGEPGARPHKGVDIAAPKGTSVFASSEGRVVRIGSNPAGYGNFIEMRHPNGLTTLYAHLSRVDVATGDEIGAEQRIGLVGSTGYSTGPHLHFEVRRNGGQVNPTKIIGRDFEVKLKTPVSAISTAD